MCADLSPWRQGGNGKALAEPISKTVLDLQSLRFFKPNFATSYKAYSHLRLKNWIVRSGLQYGVDFVVYRHHPSLVHSEYVVLVQFIGGNDRLRTWSDIHCTVRLTGRNTVGSLRQWRSMNVPSCLEDCTVEEQTIRRWSSELSREDETRT